VGVDKESFWVRNPLCLCGEMPLHPTLE
jgi:hypothetical protein